LAFDKLIPHEERHYAGLVARALNIPIHFECADDSRIFDVFDDPGFKPTEPVHMPWGGVEYDQLLRIAGHTRVALTGFGADPALSCSLSAHFRKLLRKGRLALALSDMASFLTTQKRFSRLYLAARWRIIFNSKKNQPSLPSWFNEDLDKRVGIRARFEQVDRETASAEAVRPVALEMLSATLWPVLFESYDPGLTRIPLEVRHPFFDLRLVSFLLSLPALPLCSDKELLRRAARNVLPDPVRLRRKSPLPADPLVAILQKPESSWVDSFEPAGDLERYVDRDRIPKVSEETNPWEAWIHLRPLSLSLWLQRSYTLGYKLNGEAFSEPRFDKDREESLSSTPASDVRQSAGID